MSDDVQPLEDAALEDDALGVAAEKARVLATSSEEVQQIMVVMLDSWRLYFMAHAALLPCVQEFSEDVEEQETIRRIVVESMREQATKGYTTEELVEALSGRAAAFVEAHAATGDEAEVEDAPDDVDAV